MSMQDEEIVAEFEEVAAAHSDESEVAHDSDVDADDDQDDGNDDADDDTDEDEED